MKRPQVMTNVTCTYTVHVFENEDLPKILMLACNKSVFQM